jgi:hypothetical protein
MRGYVQNNARNGIISISLRANQKNMVSSEKNIHSNNNLSLLSFIFIDILKILLNKKIMVTTNKNLNINKVSGDDDIIPSLAIVVNEPKHIADIIPYIYL